MMIRKAELQELEQIKAIYAGARQFMRDHGNSSQWGSSYPPEEIIENDIKNQKLYVCTDNGELLGVFYFAFEDDRTYSHIENGAWLNDRPYAVVHRVASAGRVKGTGRYCISWALEQAGNLKIDTHDDNLPMQNLLKSLGFTACGRIYLEDGSPRLAFQKEC